MAEVWMARQTGKHGFEKMVAVKTILPKFADDEGFQRMFLDEAHVSSRIEHPNVAQILDVGEEEDITYLVMEYVDGDALSTLHREAQSHGVRIPAGVLLRLMVEVCGGLHAAHELRMGDGQHAGVVHRDVSPHNILVSMKGVAKLIDFGLAKALDRLADETSTGIVKGKVRYMAPEQIVGPAVDRRADVWAVGATLYHLLSGEPPYEAETDGDVVRALMSGRPPRPLGGSVHPAVEAVVLRSLAWRADQRFPNAFELQRALEEASRRARLETTAKDVVSFLAEHLGHRAQQRQEAIALGMREAAEREGVASMERASARFALLTAKPGRVDARPSQPSPLPPVPTPPPSLPTPPPSATARAVSRGVIPTPEAAPRGGSVSPATALAVAIVVLVGLAFAFWLTHPSTRFTATAASAGPSTTAASPTNIAAARATSAAPSPVQSTTPNPATPLATGSAISMTVSVGDLPVASTARARVAVPVARPQAPRISHAATNGAPAGPDAEEPAAGESDDQATQGQ
jgi:serine/threonine-protein kinase